MSGTGPAALPSRAKLSAAYINTIAGALFTAGCIAPIAATVFGFAATGVRPLTVGLGVTIFFRVSASVHLVAPRAQRARSMTSMEVLAFIITPLMGLALAWGLALYVERVDGRAGPSGQ